jgi:ABC-type uncharacterized transport system ATPase subunit
MTGSQWNLFTVLEDLELVDDICLTSEKQQHLQQKTTRVANEAKKVGLNINKKKMIMRAEAAKQEMSQMDKCLQMWIGFAIWQHD